MKKRFVVELEMPEGVSATEMKAYIDDAVACMKGTYSPEDSIFYLDRESIRVLWYRQPKEKTSG